MQSAEAQIDHVDVEHEQGMTKLNEEDLRVPHLCQLLASRVNA